MATHIDTPPDKAWAQVTDEALNVPREGQPLMRRTYKVPTTACKGIINGIRRGSTIGAVETWLARTAGSFNDALSGNAIFTPPLSVDNWVLDSYQLDQLEAGQYMNLKAVFSFVDDISTSSWNRTTTVSTNVTWQPYSVSPYIYCNEKEHIDPLANLSSGSELSSGDACRRHIEGCFNQPTNSDATKVYKYIDGQNTYRQLTRGEREIMTKIAAGVNPVFHKPVITQTKVYRSNDLSSVPEDAPDIDRITEPPITVKEWEHEWVYTGRNSTKTIDVYYTRSLSSLVDEEVSVCTIQFTDTWEGALSADQDFYGPNAWNFHEGPAGNND